MCGAAIAFLGASCDSDVSDLRLDGDCAVEAVTLNDSYKGVIDTKNHSVKVKVPVDFTAKADMKVTTLQLSAGATANIAQGDVVNFEAPKNLHVANGDVFLDWTIAVKNDEARIYSFVLNGTYKAAIDEDTKTITAKLPASVDVTTLTPTIETSEDATVSPRAGVVTDFSQPVQYTVTDNTATTTYTVKVEQVTAPEAIFLGSDGPGKIEDLCGEEQEACRWMLQNIDNSLFVSWEELRNGAVDLSKCKVIFWHWQHAPSEALTDFEGGAQKTAMSCINTLKDYYQNGGAFVLGRAAVNFAAELGAVKDNLCANNCWGASDDGGDIMSGSWDFPAYNEGSWLWEGLIGGFPVKLNDAGYQISNCVSQWGKWMFQDDNFGLWEEMTGCRILAHGWDNAITMWEAPAANGEFGKGGIVCFGSGCYDWYSPAPFEENFHRNMGIITANAFKHVSE